MDGDRSSTHVRPISLGPWAVVHAKQNIIFSPPVGLREELELERNTNQHLSRPQVKARYKSKTRVSEIESTRIQHRQTTAPLRRIETQERGNLARSSCPYPARHGPSCHCLGSPAHPNTRTMMSLRDPFLLRHDRLVYGRRGA